MHNLDLPQNLTQHIRWKIVHFTPKFNLFLGENLPMLCVDEMVALHDWSEVGLRLVGCDAREGRVTVRARTVTTVCYHLKPSRDDRRKPPRPLAAF